MRVPHSKLGHKIFFWDRKKDILWAETKRCTIPNNYMLQGTWKWLFSKGHRQLQMFTWYSQTSCEYSVTRAEPFLVYSHRTLNGLVFTEKSKFCSKQEWYTMSRFHRKTKRYFSKKEKKNLEISLRYQLSVSNSAT